MGKPLAALAVIFLVAHLAFLPPTLEDIDSVNFALGVRDFDVAKHQPHPPGYPVFIALGKISTAAFQAARIPHAEPRALAFWSAVAGALMIPLLFLLFRAVDGDEPRAFWAAAVTMCAPLAWSLSGRPLSDMTGIALAVAAQGLMIAAWTGRAAPRALAWGAFLAGLSAGVRLQAAGLTAPLFLATLLVTSIPLRDRLASLGAALAGAAVWAIPLVMASGGLESYLGALGSQAGEDFAGVVMLWTMRTARVALEAVLNTFVRPWGPLVLAGFVLVLAVGGALRALGARAWRPLGLLLLLFGPYAVFHLLFHETATLRYAMPLLIPVAYLFVRGVGHGFVYVKIGVIAVSLMASVPAMTAFARDGSPAFAALRDALATGQPVAAHAGMKRVWEWAGPQSGGRFLGARHGHEWLTALDEWKANPDGRVEFIANPRRTDLALIDRQAVGAAREYRWTFPDVPFVAGARPGTVIRVSYNPPGWILDQGWALTAEVAGITERDGFGPHRRPSVAWIRGGRDARTLLIGGRHLGAAGDPDAEITVAVNGETIDRWRVQPGFFSRTWDLPAGRFTGIGYLPMQVTAASVDATRPVRVGLEQFDLQPPGVPMLALLEGWQEAEYNALTGRAWRWISERAVLWVRPAGRDVTVTLQGESALRYFDSPPRLRASVGGREISTLSPASDFTWTITVPAGDLQSASGQVVIESDKWFVPGERDGTADRRHLVTRIYRYEVR